MAALVDFWNSERGILAVALVIGATVLAVASVITADQWLDYTRWIFTAYVAGKSITGAAQVMANAKVKAKVIENDPGVGGRL